MRHVRVISSPVVRESVTVWARPRTTSSVCGGPLHRVSSLKPGRVRDSRWHLERWVTTDHGGHWWTRGGIPGLRRLRWLAATATYTVSITLPETLLMTRTTLWGGGILSVEAMLKSQKQQCQSIKLNYSLWNHLNSWAKFCGLLILYRFFKFVISWLKCPQK